MSSNKHEGQRAPVSIAVWLLTALMCLGTATRVFAQDTKAETQAERTEEADQKVRELQEPAPDGVELELASPTATEEEVEWKDQEPPAEEEPAQAVEAEEDRETFGDRFKRGDLFGYFDAQGRFFPQPATSAVPGLPVLNNYWFNGSLAWEPGFFMNITDYMNLARRW